LQGVLTVFKSVLTVWPQIALVFVGNGLLHAKEKRGD
jgi:hypothetical protein